jgi:hypothetical protein
MSTYSLSLQQHVYTTCTSECCSLLKSHTLYVEFLLAWLTVILKVVMVSFNYPFFLNFLI